MRRVYRIVWFICFAVCSSIGYLVIWTAKVRMYTVAFAYESETSRINFLRNTFCGKIISGTWETTVDKNEVAVRNQILLMQIIRSKNEYKNLSCTAFITKNGFYSKNITDLEYKNPMAFSILVYKSLYQFQVLMRTLYVRSNFHCIHVDERAPSNLYTYALQLSTCLENVHIVHPRLEVPWGTMNILQAERLCQTYLLKYSSKWHYYMTIAGTELPVQTNLNRIQILQLVPDKSRVDVSSSPQTYNRQDSKQTSPPGNMTIYKGEFHSILTRDFIEAVHTNPLAIELWSFLNDTVVPDEHFYASLVHLSELSDDKLRVLSTYHSSELLSHYKIWDDTKRFICHSGEFHRGVCQFTYKDLAKIEASGRLFANKFNKDVDFVAVDCWEQWLDIKQKYHQDINLRNYIDKYPFMQRMGYSNSSRITTNQPTVNLLVPAGREKH